MFRRETKKNSGCPRVPMRVQPGFFDFRGAQIWPRDASQCSHRACFMPTLHLSRHPQTPRKSISAFFWSLNGFKWHLRASRELQCRHKTRAVRATQCISGPDFFSTDPWKFPLYPYRSPRTAKVFFGRSTKSVRQKSISNEKVCRCILEFCLRTAYRESTRLYIFFESSRAAGPGPCWGLLHGPRAFIRLDAPIYFLR